MEQNKECRACCPRKKQRSEEEYKSLIHRLNRIEGQIRGIRGMVEQDAYCVDILTQSAAATAAINAFNRELLAQHIRTCVAQDIRDGKEQTIDSAYIEEAEFTLRDKNDNAISKDGLKFSSDTVTATQPILKTKDVPLKVSIVSGGGVTESDCRVTINPVSIKVAGDSRIVDDMESIQLGTIDLSSFDGGYEHTFPITLPEGVENITGVSDAKVTIEVSGTHTKTFTTTNIACKGVTAGYRVTVDTKEIEVTLRALDSYTLNSIRPEDITVVADLSDYVSTTGQVIVNAKVTVVGHDNVGAVGDVRVTVTIIKD